MQRITKTELSKRLEHRTECYYGGKKGLETLIYGWINHRKYGMNYRHALYQRTFLFLTEVRDLSDYAGLDLT